MIDEPRAIVLLNRERAEIIGLLSPDAQVEFIRLCASGHAAILADPTPSNMQLGSPGAIRRFWWWLFGQG